MQEVKVDSKHRVVLPEAVRKQSGIKAGSRLKVRVEGHSVVLTRNVEPREFIQIMEGILKERSKVGPSDPLKLKEIWSES
jgi:AbrB family looped-hinge helix DNA binding protein